MNYRIFRKTASLMKRGILLAALLLTVKVGAANAPVPGVPDRGELEEFQRLLDGVERNFWNALMLEPNDEFYQQTSRQIFDLSALARKIQSHVKGESELNLTTDVVVLQQAFSSVKADVLRSALKKKSGKIGRLNLRSTSLAAYKHKKGKTPTLFNVNVDGYIDWVGRTADDNAQKLVTSKRWNANNERKALRGQVQKYSLTMGRIRIKLVKIAQLVPKENP